MRFNEYIATARTSSRIFKECSPRLIWKFMYNFGWRNFRNMAAFEKRQALGAPFFPAFVMISITESCNLSCSGCWVSAGGRKALSIAQLNGIITESKRQGSYFFGILVVQWYGNGNPFRIIRQQVSDNLFVSHSPRKYFPVPYVFQHFRRKERRPVIVRSYNDKFSLYNHSLTTNR